MILTVNKIDEKIVGIIGAKKYNTKYEKELYDDLVLLLSRFDNAESFDEAKSIIEAADALVFSDEYNKIGDFLFASDSGNIYIKGDNYLSPVPIPESIAMLILKCIEEGKRYNHYIKLFLRVLNNDFLNNNLLYNVNSMFQDKRIRIDENNETFAKNSIGVTSSGLIATGVGRTSNVPLKPHETCLHFNGSNNNYVTGCIYPENIAYDCYGMSFSIFNCNVKGGALVSLDTSDFEITKRLIDKINIKAKIVLGKYTGRYIQLRSYNKNRFICCNEMNFKLRKNEVVNLPIQKILGNDEI